MTTLREAAHRLLTAIDNALPHAPLRGEFDVVADTADDLRAALAEPTGKESLQVEPVAWMVYTKDGKSVCVTDNPADFTDQHRALPLYTAPLQRKPLTDDWIRAQCKQEWVFEAIKQWVHVVEQAHGIKEGA